MPPPPRPPQQYDEDDASIRRIFHVAGIHDPLTNERWDACVAKLQKVCGAL